MGVLNHKDIQCFAQDHPDGRFYNKDGHWISTSGLGHLGGKANNFISYYFLTLFYCTGAHKEITEKLNA